MIELLRSGLEPFRPKAVTLDADGVLHLGQRLLPGALVLLEELGRRGIPWTIVTNNSRQTAIVAAAFYHRIGLPVAPEHVATAAEALARYIVRSHTFRGRPRVLMLGDPDFRRTLRGAGCQLTFDPNVAQWVAVGLDRRLSFERLKRACDAIRNGGRFVAANLDPTIPMESGPIPGVGSLAAAIAVATGVEPTNIGKPAPEMLLQSVAAMGGVPAESMHVGDRLDSDVMAARRAGMLAVLVTTGGHSRADALARPDTERPDLIADSLPALMEWMFNR